MNKERVKGKIDEILGSAKRETGAMCGDLPLQVEGIVQEVKGEIEQTWGKVKDAVQEANAEAAIHHKSRVRVALECSTAEADDRSKN
jgi:uncharacterized protein YjbJ (UPF0337 family)